MKHHTSQATRRLRDSLVAMTLLLTISTFGAPPQLPPEKEMPFDIPAFDAREINATHARLFFTPEEITLAKSRLGADAEMRRI